MLLDDDESLQSQDPVSVDKDSGWYDANSHGFDCIEAEKDFPLTVLSDLINFKVLFFLLLFQIGLVLLV